MRATARRARRAARPVAGRTPHTSSRAHARRRRFPGIRAPGARSFRWWDSSWLLRQFRLQKSHRPRQLLPGGLKRDPERLRDLRAGQPLAELQHQDVARPGRHRLERPRQPLHRLAPQERILGRPHLRDGFVARHFTPPRLPPQRVPRRVPGDGQHPRLVILHIRMTVHDLTDLQERLLRYVERQRLVPQDAPHHEIDAIAVPAGDAPPVHRSPRMTRRARHPDTNSPDLHDSLTFILDAETVKRVALLALLGAGCAAHRYRGPGATTEPEPRPPGADAPDYGRPFEIVLAKYSIPVALGLASPGSVGGWDESPSMRAFVQGWTHRPRGDDVDNGFVNYVLHPLAGSETHVIARAHGWSFVEAFLFDVFASVSWEYAFENLFERPSRTDLIVTAPLGALVGEVRWQLARRGFLPWLMRAAAYEPFLGWEENALVA